MGTDTTASLAWRVARKAGIGVAVFGLTACELAAPLDVIGVGRTVVDTRELEQPLTASPAFDPELQVVEQFGSCSMRLNKSAAVTRLTVEPLERAVAQFNDVIFPTRVEALAALGTRPAIPSMEVVNSVLKRWNDELYATIERVAEDGSQGSLVNKRATFDAILATMLAHAAVGDAGAELAAVHFAAAQQLSGGTPQLPAALAEQVSDATRKFHANVLASTPIGFYTQSAELSTIFRRDRFLQGALAEGRLGFSPAAAVAQALAADDELQAKYRGVLALYRGLTNPSQDFDPLALLDAVRSPPDTGLAGVEDGFVRQHPEFDGVAPCQARFSWLPASDSPENKLWAAETCAGRDSSNLLGALIGAIQSGAVDLTPNATSGFYDWQLYALETLLLPERSSESRHLSLTQKYRDKLVETFKSLLTQTRETHVKQVGVVTSNASSEIRLQAVDIFPLLPVEAFPTFYLRSARAYAFLRTLIDAALGPQLLSTAARTLEDGTHSDLRLGEELDAKMQLLYGLHLVSAASIGMRDELSDDERQRFDPAVAEEAARTWIAQWQSDPEVLSDPRVSVPIASDGDARLTRNIAVVGVKLIRVSANYPKGQEPLVSSAASGFDGCVVGHFVAFEPYMLVEQTLEFVRDIRLPPLTREALRQTLNGKHTLAAIRGVLESP